ncbi:MAG TPA: hypothetical protein VH639_08480 [Bryobacteraceae bacterium]|jgi:hypothetical protein
MNETGAVACRPRSRREPDAKAGSSAELIPAKQVVELVVLWAKGQTAHCRLLGSEYTVRLGSRRVWAPGEILQVRVLKPWKRGDVRLAGEVESARIDTAALKLIPLRLEPSGTWDPAKHYWGDKGEPIQKWAKPIIARGPRPAFEMEQVLPGYDYEDPELDPIGISVDLKASGDIVGARKTLMDLCRADLRCLDAHAHLGNLAFDRRPADAIRNYEVGLRIGELSLPKAFDGVLLWGMMDNRPFLRCMCGFGLCLWRLRRVKEALAIFNRMLWLNPDDNQGARFLIHDIREGRSWERRRFD